MQQESQSHSPTVAHPLKQSRVSPRHSLSARPSGVLTGTGTPLRSPSNAVRAQHASRRRHSCPASPRHHPHERRGSLQSRRHTSSTAPMCWGALYLWRRKPMLFQRHLCQCAFPTGPRGESGDRYAMVSGLTRCADVHPFDLHRRALTLTRQ